VYKRQVYVGTTEEESLLEKIFPGTTIHYTEGESISMYSAIFAPTGLSTNIAHSWEYFDAKTNTWIPQGRVSFPIAGGRDSGFRGYTEKSALFEGKWRVQVVTKRDQVLGRVVFTLEKAEKTPIFIEKAL